MPASHGLDACRSVVRRRQVQVWWASVFPAYGCLWFEDDRSRSARPGPLGTRCPPTVPQQDAQRGGRDDGLADRRATAHSGRAVRDEPIRDRPAPRRCGQHWFRFVFHGDDIVCNMSMEMPSGVTRTELVTAYRAACARSDEIVYGCPDLSTLSTIANPGEVERVSLRRITAHMIEDRLARRPGRHLARTDRRRDRSLTRKSASPTRSTSVSSTWQS